MNVVEWTEDLRLGVAELDAQHQEIFAVCNRLRAGGGSETQEDLRFLARYIDEHFANEERLMVSSHYPVLEEHREEHVRYRAALRPMLVRAAEDHSVVLDVAASVTNWLFYHIRQEDRALAGHLALGARARQS